MAHATVQEYETYSGTTAPPNAALLLTRASRLVDRELLCTVYDVDELGTATDPKVLAALREATCEQVAAWIPAEEDGTGVSEMYGTVSIGSVTLARGAGGGGSAADHLAPQARLVLEQAGLTGHAPQTQSS